MLPHVSAKHVGYKHDLIHSTQDHNSCGTMMTDCLLSLIYTFDNHSTLNVNVYIVIQWWTCIFEENRFYSPC